MNAPFEIDCPLMEQLDDRALEEVASFFSAFSVPMRLKILNALRNGERTVGDLTGELGGSQANVSKHLATLAQLGVIAKRSSGTSAFYRIVDPRIFQLCDLVCVQVGNRLAEHVATRDALLQAASPRRVARKASARR